MMAEEEFDIDALLLMHESIKLEEERNKKEERNKRDIKELYGIYYKRLFPRLQFYRWLSYGNKKIFAQREISFERGDQVFIRYQSYNSEEKFMTDFLAEILKQISASVMRAPRICPIKIDIGAMYYPNPEPGLKAVSKEMVFDIDMSDYDDLRTCCQGDKVCKNCWKYMAIACKVLNEALTEDFGLKHILWVFSGRRGIHAWVCDKRVQLGKKIRVAIAHYLNLVRGGDNTLVSGKVKLPNTLHYSITRAVVRIDVYWIDLLADQDFLGTDDRLEKFLNLIDVSLRRAFRESMSPEPKSLGRWSAFERTLSKLKETNRLPAEYKHMKEQMKLYYAYPRMDLGVTTNLPHLLKAPFCVHPKTEKICIPFEVDRVDDFDPNAVPTIDMVVKEVREHDKSQAKVDITQILKRQRLNDPVVPELKDIEHTSLLGPVNIFRKFISEMEKDRNP